MVGHITKNGLYRLAYTGMIGLIAPAVAVALFDREHQRCYILQDFLYKADLFADRKIVDENLAEVEERKRQAQRKRLRTGAMSSKHIQVDDISRRVCLSSDRCALACGACRGRKTSYKRCIILQGYQPILPSVR